MVRMIVALGALTVATAMSHAGVTAFTTKGEWEAAVGGYNAIDFTGFAHNEFLENQYASEGVLFEPRFMLFKNWTEFLNDGWGVYSIQGFGQPGGIRMYFDQPQRWFAVDYLDQIRVTLFLEGQQIGQTISVSAAPPDWHAFIGVVSTVMFDEVYLHTGGGINNVAIDDMFWGVPAPGALALLALAALALPGRARRRGA